MQQKPARSNQQRPRTECPAKMTFKEKREFEQLTSEIEALNQEKAELDSLFNSGDVIDDISVKSARYDEICGLIDEKEMRWLELSEKE